jgi:hypothetical protein
MFPRPATLSAAAKEIYSDESPVHNAYRNAYRNIAEAVVLIRLRDCVPGFSTCMRVPAGRMDAITSLMKSGFDRCSHSSNPDVDVVSPSTIRWSEAPYR